MTLTSPDAEPAVLCRGLRKIYEAGRGSGRKRAGTVLAVDGLKGFVAARWVPVLVAHLWPGSGAARENLALAAGVGIAAFLRLKKATGRKRPCALEPHCWATLLPPDQFSFPSGHTITAFAVAVSLSLFYPDLLIGLLFCALSVAASRILLGMHFLSDVLAGAAIGTALAYGSVWLVLRGGSLC